MKRNEYKPPRPSPDIIMHGYYCRDGPVLGIGLMLIFLAVFSPFILMIVFAIIAMIMEAAKMAIG